MNGNIRIVFVTALAGLFGGTALAQPVVVRAAATPCLNVRSQPKPDAGSIACLVPGTTVTADSSVPFWRRVEIPGGQRGWAAKKFLDSATTSTIDPQPSTIIPDTAWLEIHIVDVGQGDGIWISTWDDGKANGRFEGKNIVIDGGPRGADPDNDFLKYLETRAHQGARIDAMIITHPHNDHYPGARGVLRHFEVCDYYDPDFPNGSDFAKFIAKVDSTKCDGHPTVQHRGKANLGTPNWGSELKAEFLWSGPVTTGFGSGNTLDNNNSVVLKLTYGTQSFLFMGDAEGKERDQSPATARYAEAAMLADSATKAKLKSTLIKLAHHGSETSSTLPFIEAVDPRIVVASSGRKDFNGTFLPDTTVFLRYCAHDAATRIYRTDKNDKDEGRSPPNDADGDHIVIRTNGKRTEVQAFSNGQPLAAPTSCAP